MCKTRELAASSSRLHGSEMVLLRVPFPASPHFASLLEQLCPSLRSRKAGAEHHPPSPTRGLKRKARQGQVRGEGVSRNQSAVLLSLSLSLFFVFLPLLGPLPVAYGGTQARGQIGATTANLHQSHSNTGSELRLRPTP